MKCKQCGIEYDIQYEIFNDFCSVECYNLYLFQIEKNKGEVNSMLELWDWK